VILTGAPGSGKSTVIDQLREREFQCVDEPARQILAEQRRINGAGVYDKDPHLFVELLLSRAISEYGRASDADRAVFFDRARYFYNLEHMSEFLAQVRLAELEFRAQRDRFLGHEANHQIKPTPRAALLLEPSGA